jgi:hypothetical protein
LRELAKYREAILKLALARGARKVRLFGSVARGDSRPDSDIDILVEMDPSRSLIDRVGLRLDLEELLQRRVDLVTERSLYPPIRARVLSEAISL